MDLRQLAALVAVADHGSFSAAAKALFTVQSNVSAHVAHLERELGVKLVDRAHGRLTTEGEVVAARARQVQRELDAIAHDVTSLQSEVAGDARLGVIGTTARWLIPMLLPVIQSSHSRIRTVVVEASTSSLLPQLGTGQLDLAVVNTPVDDPELEVVPLFEEELVVLAPSGHPLASLAEVEVDELARHRLLLPPPGTALRDDLDHEARRAGVRLDALAEIDGARLLTSLAFEGFGPTIVPATAVPGWLTGDFVRVPIVGVPTRQVGLCRRRRTLPSAATSAVASLIVDVIRTRGPRQRGVRLIGDLPDDRT
jgi:LysR family hydrogen peroxide-inducible transcriptional activator